MRLDRLPLEQNPLLLPMGHINHRRQKLFTFSLPKSSPTEKVQALSGYQSQKTPMKVCLPIVVQEDFLCTTGGLAQFKDLPDYKKGRKSTHGPMSYG